MRTRAIVLLSLGIAAAVDGGMEAAAQTAAIDERTEVRGVRIDVPGGLDFGQTELLGQIATRGHGRLTGVRHALRWIPFVPAVRDRTLDLLEVHRDRERLRRFLARRGYPEAVVEYDLEPTDEDGAVDVLFRVQPGRPLIVAELSIEWRDSTTPLARGGDEALAELGIEPPIEIGEPLDSASLRPAALALGRWLGSRGYAFGTVSHVVEVDTAAAEARVVLVADPGPATRIGRIETTGEEALREQALRRYAGVRPGDPFSLEELERAGERVSGLDLVREATFRVPPGQPEDTVVDVELRVVEELPREVTGEVGYGSDGGIAGEAGWTHRSIFRGAQTLSVTVAGQTGLFALGENPEKFVRGTVSLRQPIGGRARLTLDLAPYVGFRNDYRDRSLDYGVEATLLQRLGPSSSVALRYEISTRRIYEYRFGDISAGIDFLELAQLSAEGVADSLGARIDRSTVSLSGSFGALDSPTDPRRGFAVEPSVGVTVPAALTSIQYATVNVRSSGYLPVTDGFSLAARLGAGRVLPFGKSIPPSQDEGIREYFRLRDVLLTAGGNDDVRGWPDGLLGPKFPQVVFGRGPDSTSPLVDADRYVPIGGFNRVHGSLEARLHLPFLGDAWAAHGFLDGGRVWTDDERFTSNDDPLGVENLFWATGAGIDYATPVGAVRFGVGYKLNPSLLDLVRPGELARAILDGTPFNELPRNDWRRLQIHIGLGRRL